MTRKEREERIHLELELLQKAKWKASDIMRFFDCASEKANNLRKEAAKKGGKIDFDPHAVQSRAVLAIYGTTPEAEIRKRYIELTGEAPEEIDI